MSTWKFVQHFYGNGACKPPVCRDCTSRAIGTWTDGEQSPDWCMACRVKAGAPEKTPGIAYVPKALISLTHHKRCLKMALTGQLLMTVEIVNLTEVYD